MQIFRWNGEEFSEHRLHGIAIEAAGAAQEFFRIGHVRRADFVDVNLERGILANERAGCAGVIEMDVGEENEIQVARGEAARGKFGAKVSEAAGGAAIYERELTATVKEDWADRFRHTHVVKIEDGCCRGDENHLGAANLS